MSVGAWFGRLFLLVLAALCLIGPPVSITENPLLAASWLLGGAFIGFAAQTFRSTERLGSRVAWLCLWAMFTYVAIVAFVDPGTVISDSQRSRKGFDLESNGGAYAAGAFFLVVGNVFPALVLWDRWTTWRRRRADPDAG